MYYKILWIWSRASSQYCIIKFNHVDLRFFCNIQQLHSIRSLHMAGDVGQMSCFSCDVHLINTQISLKDQIFIFIMFIVIV